MIKEVIMFTILCDNCGVDVNKDTDYSCWSDVEYNEEISQEKGWEKVDDKHYCNNCFEYDDEDNLVILEQFKNK